MRRPRAQARAAIEALAKAPTEIAGRDEITRGGVQRDRPTLLGGSAGCGKTLLAMKFLVRRATLHDEPGAFRTFAEKAREPTTNMVPLGRDLAGLAARRRLFIVHMHIDRSEIEKFAPAGCQRAERTICSRSRQP